MVEKRGIEPRSTPCKGVVIPLYYFPKNGPLFTLGGPHQMFGSSAWNRTRLSQINSLLPHLAAPEELIGRSSWIRTNDLLLPKQTHYQAVLYSVQNITYTNCLASHHGFEPRPRVLETHMLPLTPVTNNIGGPTGNRTPNAGVTGQNYYRLTTGPNFGREGGIRTHGTFPFVGFQDRCIQPGSATSPILLVVMGGIEPPTA